MNSYEQLGMTLGQIIRNDNNNNKTPRNWG